MNYKKKQLITIETTQFTDNIFLAKQTTIKIEVENYLNTLMA